MKKLLLTLIVAFTFSGTIFAQEYESHWPDFNLYAYEMNDGIVAFAQIDGVFVEATDDWSAMEIAAFVGDDCRGHMFLNNYTDEGDPHPIVEIAVYWTNQNETVTFQMYNHATGVLYEECTNSFEILTGTDHDELYFDYDAGLVLNFASPAAEGYEKEIIGYDEGGHYYLIASPLNGEVSPVDVANMTTAEYDLYYFDQDTDGEGNEWIDYKDANDGGYTLVPGKGYLYAHNTTVTLTFSGEAYDGEGVFALEYNAAAPNFPGYNLVGNPYLENATIGRDFLRMGENDEFELCTDEEAEIAPFEGVIVEAAAAGEEVTFNVGTGGGGMTPGGGFKLDVKVRGANGNGDLARIRFGQGHGLTKYQINASSTRLSFPVDNSEYAVVYADNMGETPVNFKASANGMYTLSFTTNGEFGYLHLIDNMTGTDTDLLATPSYSFEAATTDYASRFKLVYATGANEESFAFFSNGSFVISNEGNATLQVVDVTGRILSSESIDGCASLNVNAAPGVYMIRLINGDNVKVQKVVVR